MIRSGCVNKLPVKLPDIVRARYFLTMEDDCNAGDVPRYCIKVTYSVLSREAVFVSRCYSVALKQM